MDDLLKQAGMARAIRDTARLAQGILDPEQALDWAVTVGYLVRGPERDQVTFTERGMALAYTYWKAIAESMAVHAGELALSDTQLLTKTDNRQIHLPGGGSILLDRKSLADATDTLEPSQVADAIADQAVNQDTDPCDIGESLAIVPSDTRGDNPVSDGEEHDIEGDLAA